MLRITGPFLDKRKKDQPKQWFLRYATPRLNTDGTIVRDAAGDPQTQRHRPYYETKAAANADKPRIVEQHSAAGSGSFLFDRGAATEYEEARRIAGKVSLVEVAKFWRLHNPDKPPENCRALLTRFLAASEERLGDSKHTRDLKSRIGAFTASPFGDRSPGTITRKEILQYLKALVCEPRTRRNHLGALNNFFWWMCEEEIIAASPAARIKRRMLPKETHGEIRFLSLDETIRYLRAAERYDPDLVAHEIVQLVAGVRADDEMANFKAEFVLPQTREVVIPASIAKTGQREVIGELEKNFWVWWSEYGPSEGLLRPKNYLRRWRRIRFLATILDREQANTQARVPLKRLLQSKDVAEALADWPWNARRRTFCTFHVAKHQGAEKTALILRHRGSTYTLHESYRGKGITQEQGKMFFRILPEPVPSPIRPIAGIRGAAFKKSETSDQDLNS